MSGQTRIRAVPPAETLTVDARAVRAILNEEVGTALPLAILLYDRLTDMRSPLRQNEPEGEGWCIVAAEMMGALNRAEERLRALLTEASVPLP